MVCKQCQNCAFINGKQVQNWVTDIGMGQPISSWDHHTASEWGVSDQNEVAYIRMRWLRLEWGGSDQDEHLLSDGDLWFMVEWMALVGCRFISVVVTITYLKQFWTVLFRQFKHMGCPHELGPTEEERMLVFLCSCLTIHNVDQDVALCWLEEVCTINALPWPVSVPWVHWHSWPTQWHPYVLLTLCISSSHQCSPSTVGHCMDSTSITYSWEPHPHATLDWGYADATARWAPSGWWRLSGVTLHADFICAFIILKKCTMF